MELREIRKPKNPPMASYTEILGEEEAESDSAQPSTSTASAHTRRSDLDLKAPDVTTDLRMDGDTAGDKSGSSGGGGKQNGGRHVNHVSNKHGGDKNRKAEVDRDTEADSRSRDFEFCIKMPMSDGPIIDLRGREVLFAIGVFFFLSVSIGLVVVLASDHLKRDDSPSKSTSRTQCVTPTCLSRAADMLDMMDPSADPCSDFYRYACGGWLDGNDIPPWTTSWGVDKQLTERLQGYMDQILKSDIHNKNLNSTERKMKTFYRKCLNLEEIDDAGLAPVLNIMDNMGGWAIFDDWNMPSKPGSWNFQTVLRDLHHKYFVKMFFMTLVRPDDVRGGNSIQLDQSAFPYPDLYYSGPDLQEAYLSYMRTVVEVFDPSRDSLEQFMSSSWQFERELADIHIPEMHPDRADPYGNYNNMTIAELQQAAPRIKWLEYIQDAFPHMTSDSVILVTNLNFFENLSELLSRTDGQTLNYYMLWRLVDDMARDLPEEIRKAHRHFTAKYTGSRVLKSRDQYCLDKTNAVFGFEVGASFAQEYFPENDKKELERMVDVLKTEMHNVISDCSWIDGMTKSEALRKTDLMTVLIGYPDFVLHQSDVDKYYANFAVSSDELFLNLLSNSYVQELHLMRQMLNGTIVAEAWDMPIHESNAYNNPTSNSIVFPAGLLLRPYYDHSVPHYLNYGAIGSIIAHEMIHAYDGLGSFYDADGRMGPWIGPNASEQFSIRKFCVARYFSSQTYKGHQIDGFLTSTETIADIEGLKLAYQSYKNVVTEEQSLPGLKGSNDQLFFLSFAQGYCKKRRDDLIGSYLNDSQHMIEPLRVRGSVSQMPEFARAYNCPKNSPLNPPERCDLWGA